MIIEDTELNDEDFLLSDLDLEVLQEFEPIEIEELY